MGIEPIDKVIQSSEFKLQLHSKRYDASQRSFELMIKSVITFNGGALVLLLSSGFFKDGEIYLNFWFAIFFVLGCMSSMLALIYDYFYLLRLIQNTKTYEINIESNGMATHDNLGRFNYRNVSILFVIFSTLFFCLGVSLAFWEFQSTLTPGAMRNA